MANGAPGADDRPSFHIGFGKASLDIAGAQVLMIVVALGLMALVAGAGYIQMTYIRTAEAEHREIRLEHTAMKDLLRENLDELKFLLTVPDGQRPALVMPPSLRQKLLDQEWYPRAR